MSSSSANSATTSAATAPELAVGLDAEAALLVAGEDAPSYLHSQFSSDVLNAPAGRSVLTSYSDPRGRLLAVLRVLPREPAGLMLVMDAGVREQVASQLRKYALRARVEVTEPDDAWLGLGVSGERTAEILGEHIGTLPEAVNEHLLSTAGISVTCLPGPQPRWALWGPRAALDELRPALAAAAADSPDAWRRLDIEAGLPRITNATAGRFVAQMVNLDRLDAIDFHKGCYPGQEVIARTHYLGRIKRRMLIVDINGPPPAAGDPVHAADSEAAVGEMVDAVATAGGSVGLAVLRLENAGAELRVGDPEGEPGSATATSRMPPYDLAGTA